MKIQILVNLPDDIEIDYQTIDTAPHIEPIHMGASLEVIYDEVTKEYPHWTSMVITIVNGEKAEVLQTFVD